jgi:hypothetical protein
MENVPPHITTQASPAAANFQTLPATTLAETLVAQEETRLKPGR